MDFIIRTETACLPAGYKWFISTENSQSYPQWLHTQDLFVFNSLNCFCKNINVFQYKERKWVNANGILKNVCSKIALHIVLFVIFVCVSDSCFNVPLNFLRIPENAWRLKSRFFLVCEAFRCSYISDALRIKA